ncbi:MAG TPA: type I 3-dehydroquinate dehydratase [Nitrososphaerales archaeon]|nr:type I 3-dehydroquinate dehydratase [Nitrososphaerales archaeon]
MVYFSPSTNQIFVEKFSRRICVSVYGRDLRELRNNVALAQSFDPGYIEFRLDYLTAALEKLRQLKQQNYPSTEIFTFRSRREGGTARVSEKVRKQILMEILSEIAPPLIDIEISTLNVFSEIVDSLHRSASRKTKLIASSHNFQKTEDLQILEDIVKTAAKQYHPEVIKVVRQANHFEDNLKMLSLYRLAEEIKPTRLVAFCMGALGIFSRVACVSYGSPFTYASLPSRETASGQLDVKIIKTLLDSWEM